MLVMCKDIGPLVDVERKLQIAYHSCTKKHCQLHTHPYLLHTVLQYDLCSDLEACRLLITTAITRQ